MAASKSPKPGDDASRLQAVPRKDYETPAITIDEGEIQGSMAGLAGLEFLNMSISFLLRSDQLQDRSLFRQYLLRLVFYQQPL